MYPKLKKNSEIEHSSWDAKTCKNIETVNSGIQVHKANPLKKLRIRLYVNKSAHFQVTKWLEFALSRQVEDLELDFQYGYTDCSYMVVLEESLREMRMSSFRSIKRLCLQFMKVSGEDISLFLRNCPLLRELIVISSVLTSDVDVDVCAVALEVLDIRWCHGKKSIKVCAPNLTSVAVDARSGEKLVLENIPKVVEAAFIMRRLGFGAQHFARALSSFISQLQTLTLTLHYPKVRHDAFFN